MAIHEILDWWGSSQVLAWGHLLAAWVTAFMCIWRMQCIAREPYPKYLQVRRVLFGLLAGAIVLNGTRPVLMGTRLALEDVVITVTVGALLVLSPLNIPETVKSRILL